MFNKSARCGNKWANKRAILVEKSHEDVILITPGGTIFPEIKVQNGTQWPWKKGCKFGLDNVNEGDSEVSDSFRILAIPIHQLVAGE